jgi:hypothetical protein
MRKHFRLPLFYLVLAAALGLLLRWNLISPVEGFTYGYWLHAHSHLMFLGWVFNFFNLAFLYNAFGNIWRKPYRILFILNQFLILGMLFSFPVQGYGSITIPLSIAHTLVSAFFCVRFIIDTRQQRSVPSVRLAVWSLIFFLISSVGPFALGPIMMQGLGQSRWYYFAIYFYLHFQYNGVFMFGVLSILSRWCEDRGLDAVKDTVLKAGRWLALAAFPTYALSLLWAEVPLIFNWIGFTGAIIQLGALLLLWRQFIRVPMLALFQKTSRLLVAVVSLSFVTKIVLQALSALPVVAVLAYVYKSYVIAYLHLVLIGVITLSILIWYIEQRLLSVGRIWIILLLTGFLLSEVVMVLIPSFQLIARHSGQILFSVSIFIFLGFAGFMLNLTKDKL